MKKDAIAFARQFLSTNILVNDVRKDDPTSPEIIKQQVTGLKRSAKNPDTNEYDVLVVLAADRLRATGSMPEWLAEFAADVLEGKRKRPTKRGPDKNRNFARDYSLFRTTQEVAKSFNLPLYTNNELSTKTTAAAVVSEASGYKLDVVITSIKKFLKMGWK